MAINNPAYNGMQHPTANLPLHNETSLSAEEIHEREEQKREKLKRIAELKKQLKLKQEDHKEVCN
jgi:hypothetical protein